MTFRVHQLENSVREELYALAAELGTIIRGERNRLGWSQVELAQKVDVQQNTISLWERAAEQLERGENPVVSALTFPAIMTLERAFKVKRYTILQRLVPEAFNDPEHIDFDAVVMADDRMTPDQKDALVRLRRAMVGEKV